MVAVVEVLFISGSIVGRDARYVSVTLASTSDKSMRVRLFCSQRLSQYGIVALSSALVHHAFALAYIEVTSMVLLHGPVEVPELPLCPRRRRDLLPCDGSLAAEDCVLEADWLLDEVCPIDEEDCPSPEVSEPP